jgi:DNA-binding CsgD family transcriptional regulator
LAAGHLLALFTAPDLDSLIDMAFVALLATVTCDFASAFYHSSELALLMERDSLGRKSRPEFMRRYAELTPALPLALANPGIKILTTRECLPRSRQVLERSPFFREIMQPQGWRHGVALCFWGSAPAEAPVFVASTYRSQGRRDFTEEEVVRLSSVHPFIDCAVNRLHERVQAQKVRDGVVLAMHDEARGLALLDENFTLVQATALARTLCGSWLAGEGTPSTERTSDEWRLPPDILASCRVLRLQCQSPAVAESDEHARVPSHRICHSAIDGLTASIRTIVPSEAGLAGPSFLIEFNNQRGHATPVLELLSASERDVAVALGDGLSNQEIADELGKSVSAVKFLLHRIFQKTGIPNRAALVAALRGR